MFERFTPDAKRAVVLAQEFEREVRTPGIEVDHLVRGVIALPQSVGSELLVAIGVDLAWLSTELAEQAVHGSATVEGHIPFTADAKEVISQTLHASMSLHDDHIGTEHLILVTLMIGGSQTEQFLSQPNAAARYRAAIEARPDRAAAGATQADPTLLAQAYRLLQVGDGPAALTHADVALADAVRAGSQPDLAHTQNLVAWLIALQVLSPRFDEALDLIDQAVAALPDSEPLVGTRLAVLTVLGRGPETIAGQERILSLGDDVLGEERGVSHSFLARAYLDAGDVERARFHLEEADRHPSPWPIHADTWRRIDELDGRWLPPNR